MQLCFEHLFVDGTKIEANANKYSFVWKKSTNKYERSKTKKFKSNMALRENMKYDEFLDEYTCQNGKKLKAVYDGKRRFLQKL